MSENEPFEEAKKKAKIGTDALLEGMALTDGIDHQTYHDLAQRIEYAHTTIDLMEKLVKVLKEKD